jgi:hypothetical protein
MTIRKNHEGAYVITDLVDGHLMTRMFYGYTKREAISLFIQARREARR